ncbi:hypothetical protein DMC30DRAFT_400386 [Rhodotorula diobovata]|uniref:Uncharacterized protein n=1 Tax=Rhodotorula diobovata TaxID=5288 RepID=A0A5C5FTA8_9BASI|nr:hypothetical protein DMC30DRAFT_400386 [Rhodotorula diobovata]
MSRAQRGRRASASLSWSTASSPSSGLPTTSRRRRGMTHRAVRKSPTPSQTETGSCSREKGPASTPTSCSSHPSSSMCAPCTTRATSSGSRSRTRTARSRLRTSSASSGHASWLTITATTSRTRRTLTGGAPSSMARRRRPSFASTAERQGGSQSQRSLPPARRRPLSARRLDARLARSDRRAARARRHRARRSPAPVARSRCRAIEGLPPAGLGARLRGGLAPRGHPAGRRGICQERGHLLPCGVQQGLPGGGDRGGQPVAWQRGVLPAREGSTAGADAPVSGGRRRSDGVRVLRLSKWRARRGRRGSLRCLLAGPAFALSLCSLCAAVPAQRI